MYGLAKAESRPRVACDRFACDSGERARGTAAAPYTIRCRGAPAGGRRLLRFSAGLRRAKSQKAGRRRQSRSVQRSAAAAKAQPLEESRRRRSVHGLCAAYPRSRAAGARPAGGTGTSPRDSRQALATPTTPQLHADHRDPSLWERTKPAITEPATS